MFKKQIFYSFHFDKDVMRVQQIRNIGAIEGNSPVSANDWEKAKNTPGGVKKWIDENMKHKSCVVVLIGEETYQREWVKYEIKKAWEDGRGVMGIYIHNIRCPRQGTCRKGRNPFSEFTLNGSPLSNIVPCYDPSSYNAYGEIAKNIGGWIEHAIQVRKSHS